jgi:predicted flap endonuclease-1-like 5' DNA nuclease
MAKITDVEGIGPKSAEKLDAAGVANTDDLAEKGRTPGGRKALAEETGISGKNILTWVNMVDLMRVKGVGGEFAELLQASGVDTVKELRRRNAENLAAKMAEVNEDKKLTRSVPSEKVVTKWVEAAKDMEPGVEY